MYSSNSNNSSNNINNSNKSKQILQAEQLIIQTLEIHPILEVDEDELSEETVPADLISACYYEDHFSAEDYSFFKSFIQQEKQDTGSQAAKFSLAEDDDSLEMPEEEGLNVVEVTEDLSQEKEPTKLRRTKSYDNLNSWPLEEPFQAPLVDFFLRHNPLLQARVQELSEKNSRLEQAIRNIQANVGEIRLKLAKLQATFLDNSDEDEFVLVSVRVRTGAAQKLELNQSLLLAQGSKEKEDHSSFDDFHGNKTLLEFSHISRGTSTKLNFLTLMAEAQDYILKDLKRKNYALTAQVSELEIKNQSLEQTLSETREALGKAYQDLGKLQQLLLAGETIEKVVDTVETGLNLSDPKPPLELRNMTVKCEPVFKEELNSKSK